jgi:hypothetical protein
VSLVRKRNCQCRAMLGLNGLVAEGHAPEAGSLFRGCRFSGSAQHVVVDRSHVGGQTAKGLGCLCLLVRELGHHLPEMLHFLAKLSVLTDQPRDHRVELVLLLGALSEALKRALHVREPANEFRGKV